MLNQGRELRTQDEVGPGEVEERRPEGGEEGAQTDCGDAEV